MKKLSLILSILTISCTALFAQESSLAKDGTDLLESLGVTVLSIVLGFVAYKITKVVLGFLGHDGFKQIFLSLFVGCGVGLTCWTTGIEVALDEGDKKDDPASAIQTTEQTSEVKSVKE